MKRVNRPAEVGEYIQIVNIDDSEERYQNGDILKVMCTYTSVPGDVYVEGTDPDDEWDDEWLVCYEEYVVLEDYNPCELQQKVYSGDEDVIDALRYCTNDILTCKKVGKNLLKTTELTVDKPILHITPDCFITINENNVRTEITPDGMCSYIDDKLIFKYENEKEGMINMNQVLKLYIDKHLEEIASKYSALIEKDYKELEIVKEYKELINEFEINLQLLFDREENQINNVFERVVTHNVYKYDLDESRLKNEIAIKYSESEEQERKELHDLIKEVEAQLSLSDELEYQLDVLKRYDIINKKTNKVN